MEGAEAFAKRGAAAADKLADLGSKRAAAVGADNKAVASRNDIHEGDGAANSHRRGHGKMLESNKPAPSGRLTARAEGGKWLSDSWSFSLDLGGGDIASEFDQAWLLYTK